MKKVSEVSAYDCWVKLEKGYKVAHQIAEDDLRPVGISLQEFKVLSLAASGVSLRQMDIAKELYVSAAAVSKLLDKLIGLEFVQKEKDTRDGRALIISLTAKGKEVHQKATKVHQESVRKIMKGYSPEQRKKLFEMLGLIPNQD